MMDGFLALALPALLTGIGALGSIVVTALAYWQQRRQTMVFQVSSVIAKDGKNRNRVPKESATGIDVTDLLAGLANTPSAAIRLGSLLIIKNDGNVSLRELNAKEQRLLDEQDEAFNSPDKMRDLLHLD